MENNYTRYNILRVKNKMFYKTVTLLALLLVMSQAEVVVLDDSNYTSFVQQHPFVFVKFYAPWCGHCKSMAQDYIQLGEASVGKEYVIAEVDATVAQNVSAELGVQGYPSVKFIVSGSVIDYEGERSAASMQKWIQELIRAEINQVAEDDLKSLIGTQNLVVVQGASQEQLRSLGFSQSISKIPFYAVEGTAFKLTVYLANSKTIEYTGEVNIKAVANWVTEQTLGHLVALSGQNVIKKIFENEGQLPALLLLKNSDFTDEAFQTLRAYCESQEKVLKCAYSDTTHEIYKGISNFLGGENAQESILAYVDYGIKNGYKFANLSELSQQSLAQFLSDVAEGKVAKFHDEQKEKEQKQIKYTNVVKLNNQTYNDTLANNKYVFVEYYSATCGYCVKFAPQYEELATKLKTQNSEYVIAAVDLSVQTEIKDLVDVSGFPTFKFYINGQELEYNGDRNGDSIINFMNEAVKSKLKTVSSVEELQKPAIAVYGVDQSSSLHLLPLIYSRLPIYQVLGDSEFKVEIHDKKSATYTGEQELKAVAQWLEESTQPTIVNVVEEQPSKKLSKALEEQTPILIIINRDNSETFNTAYAFLETFCEQKHDYICGVANKDDAEYNNFNDWVGDSENQNSALIYLHTEKFEKYLFTGDLASLNADAVSQFVNDVKEGKIEAFQGKQEAEAEAEAGEAAEAEAAEGEATQEAVETEVETESNEESAAEAAEEQTEAAKDQEL